MSYKPRYKKLPWEADERTQAQHERALRELEDVRYPNQRMYDVATLKGESFDEGFEVTFWQDGVNYTSSEYANVVNEFLKYVPDHKAHAWKVNNQPRIYFRIPDTRAAYRLARKYNQPIIWDNERDEEVKITPPRRRS